ncbi:MAG: epoxide hydrolase family protein [Thermomicrobiales bacterium]
MNSSTDIQPFRIDIPQADLDDLQERLQRVRLAEELPGVDWDYGVPVEFVQDLVEYWRDGYDWRVWEAKFNQYPQFTTEIDGQTIHFLHVQSPEPNALPLILTHGWPGSIAEFLDIIGPLTDPRSHGGDPATAFHLVIPSLPGFGFSGPTKERGWNTYRIAKAWAELMPRLGYDRYGAAGNDWGTYISLDLARLAPQAVIGVHVTQIFALPTGEPGELDGLTADELATLKEMQWWDEHWAVHDVLQFRQPQTLAHALADSPAGLLGWHCQLYRELDADYILSNVTIHWLTGTVASAMQLYYEFDKAPAPTEPTPVPVGLAQFTHDFKAIRPFAERENRNIVSWHEYDRPGHFAAHQSPDILIADMRAFFAGLRPR